MASDAQTIANIRRWLVMETETCDCFARSSGECACGAWDDYKTVAMPNLLARFDAEFPSPTKDDTHA